MPPVLSVPSRLTLIKFTISFTASLTLAGLLSIPLASQTTPDQSRKVDKIFDQWNKADSPGCALGVYQDGQIVYKHGYGMANLNDDIPITPATVFHVASMSKQFTAFSILLLQAQGKLSLDDDVHKYIPELPKFDQPITLREMLHHTSGLRDQWALLGLAGWRYSQDLITDKDVMSVLVHQKDLNFKPGDKYMYSNTGFTLLAIIVSQVSGMSFREFSTKNIFEPLGMTHTHFRDDHEEVIKHDALGYEKSNEQDGKDHPFRMNLTNFDTAGATSLHTTVEDLELWDENFYQPKVGTPPLIQQMVERGKLNSGEQQDYASGLVIGTYRGLPTVDHGGADAGYRSDMTRFPEQHFSVAVLCNFASTDPGGLARQVADIYLAKDLKPASTVADSKAATAPAIPLTAAQANALAGLYWNQEEDDFTKIEVKDGKLQIDLGENDLHPLKPFADSHFHIEGVPRGEHVDLHFLPAADGKPRRFERSFDQGKPQTFVVVTPFEPTATQLADYTGKYGSAEIEPTYRLSIDDKKLTLHRYKNKPDTLTPTIEDVFTGDIGNLHFTRNQTHQINGFTLNTGRIENMQFTKKAE